jgi:hypothetical protein
MTILKYALYGLFGVVMSVSGINVVEKPIEFIGTLLIVLCIDIISKLEM